MEELLYCYNKGCGIKYKPSENSENACHFHPGQPVFHDALKGWSCCKKRSTDFTEFLNIPGCATGLHSNVKPVVEAGPAPKQIETPESKEVPQRAAKPIHPVQRPSDKEPMTVLEIDVAESYKQTLDEQVNQIKMSTTNETPDRGLVVEGTSCKNCGCTATYKNESSNDEMCIYHSGIPIFHEGMKYWSCCQQKTTDFTAFLNQAGCSNGRHLWAKQDDGTKVACRHDWHQTTSFVTITVFSKFSSPAKTIIKANKVLCSIYIVFEQGKNVFQQDITLKGVIDPEKSRVKIMGAKVEINLKKLEPGNWSGLSL